jgi:hypothetical protein
MRDAAALIVLGGLAWLAYTYWPPSRVQPAAGAVALPQQARAKEPEALKSATVAASIEAPMPSQTPAPRPSAPSTPPPVKTSSAPPAPAPTNAAVTGPPPSVTTLPGLPPARTPAPQLNTAARPSTPRETPQASSIALAPTIPAPHESPSRRPAETPQQSALTRPAANGPRPVPLKDPLPRIDSILIDRERRLAVIDGQIVGVGAAIGPRVVTGIERDAVILREPSGWSIRVPLRSGGPGI